jgi:hypothetical protein
MPEVLLRSEESDGVVSLVNSADLDAIQIVQRIVLVSGRSGNQATRS